VQEKVSRQTDLSYDDTKVRHFDCVQLSTVSTMQEISPMEKAEQPPAIKEKH